MYCSIKSRRCVPAGRRAHCFALPATSGGVPRNAVLSARKQHLRDCRIGAKRIQAREFVHIARHPRHALSAIIAVELPRRPEAPLPDTARRGSRANRPTDENVSADTYNAAATEGGDRSSNPRAAERVAALG